MALCKSTIIALFGLLTGLVLIIMAKFGNDTQFIIGGSSSGEPLLTTPTVDENGEPQGMKDGGGGEDDLENIEYAKKMKRGGLIIGISIFSLSMIWLIYCLFTNRNNTSSRSPSSSSSGIFPPPPPQRQFGSNDTFTNNVVHPTTGYPTSTQPVPPSSFPTSSTVGTLDSNGTLNNNDIGGGEDLMGGDMDIDIELPTATTTTAATTATTTPAVA